MFAGSIARASACVRDVAHPVSTSALCCVPRLDLISRLLFAWPPLPTLQVWYAAVVMTNRDDVNNTGLNKTVTIRAEYDEVHLFGAVNAFRLLSLFLINFRCREPLCLVIFFV